jgi:hypothetical protein
VLEPEREPNTRCLDPLPLGGEERRPAVVVFNKADEARLEAEGVSHRIGRRIARRRCRATTLLYDLSWLREVEADYRTRPPSHNPT